jgi:2-polyprenyl-6-methoxyphenol hydroxylase-like FAD-dependent oxidoreductase
MRIEILGGGPAGLYFAILMQQANKAARITVHERNRADDTFGFGVVFSDATLATFEKYDPESYRAITANFAYWDDIEIRFKGTTHRIGGNGFCGCARRTLLMLLQDRARALGVTLRFETEIAGIDDPAIAGADRYKLTGSGDLRGALPAASRSAPEPLRLDGFDPPARRVHIFVPRDAVRRVHRPRLPIRARPLHLGDGNQRREL